MIPALPPFMWTASLGRPAPSKSDLLPIVNRYVNNGIDRLPGFPAIDASGRYFPKAGWCIDYAWTKREELLTKGYRVEEVLLCECAIPDDDRPAEKWDRHMVLIANGVVLDNLNQQIVPVERMRYKIVRQQSAADPDKWEAP